MTTKARVFRQLFVEGKDDLYVAVATVKRLRPNLPQDANTWAGGFKAIDCKGDAQVGPLARAALKGGKDARVGILLDADDQSGKRASDRWSWLQRELKDEGLAFPAACPADGWHATLASGARVGIWLMPDNRREGALEAFVEPFVPSEDPGFAFARECVAKARTDHGVPVAPKEVPKAVLATWLAWREEPGRPYGRAIDCGDLDPTGDATAAAFVEWFEVLFIR